MKQHLPRLSSLVGCVIVIHSLALTCYRFTFPSSISYFEEALSFALALLSLAEAAVSFASGLFARAGDPETRRIGRNVMVLSGIALLLSLVGPMPLRVYDKAKPYELQLEISRRLNSPVAPR